MEKINYTITVYVPGNICNLRCNYCYISQCVDSDHMMKPVFNYSLEHMLKAFSPKRIGICDIIIIGSGETLIPDEVVPFVHGLLDQGHYVEVVTNLTLDKRIDELLDIDDKNKLHRLLVKGSIHYLELKRRNLLPNFFNNMNKIAKAGASTYPFLVLCNDYMPYLEEIRELCLKNIGDLPQLSPCIAYDEENKTLLRNGVYHTDPLCDEYMVKKIDSLFDSRIFDVCVEMLKYDPKKVFCYAGKYGFGVGMGAGTLIKCHGMDSCGNFYENVDNLVDLSFVGNKCNIVSCALQYNFVSQGFIPEIEGLPTYGYMLSNRNLIRRDFIEAMNFKYYDYKERLSSNEERIFLMDNISGLLDEKKNLIEKYNVDCTALCKKIVEITNKDNSKLIDEVMEWFQCNRWRDLQNNITYKHIKAMYDSSLLMENGMEAYQNLCTTIIRKLYAYGKAEKEWIRGLEKMMNSMVKEG